MSSRSSRSSSRVRKTKFEELTRMTSATSVAGLLADSLSNQMSIPILRPVGKEHHQLVTICAFTTVLLMLSRFWNLRCVQHIKLIQIPALLFNPNDEHMHLVWESIVYTISVFIAIFFLKSQAFKDLNDLYNDARIERATLFTKVKPDQTKWYHLSHKPQNIGLIGCFLFLCQIKSGWEYGQKDEGVDFIFHCLFYIPLWWNVLLYTRVMTMLVYCIDTERFFVKSTSFSIKKIRQRRQKILALSSNYRWIERWWNWFVCYGILTIIIYTRKTMDNSSVTQSKIKLYGLSVDKITPIKYTMWAKQHLEASTDQLSFLIHATRIIQPVWLLICIVWWKNMVQWQAKSLVRYCGRRADQTTTNTDDAYHWDSYASFLTRKNLSLSFSFSLGLARKYGFPMVGWWLLLSFDHLWSAMTTKSS